MNKSLGKLSESNAGVMPQGGNPPTERHASQARRGPSAEPGAAWIPRNAAPASGRAARGASGPVKKSRHGAGGNGPHEGLRQGIPHGDRPDLPKAANQELTPPGAAEILETGGKRGRIPLLWDGLTAERIVRVLADPNVQ